MLTLLPLVLSTLAAPQSTVYTGGGPAADTIDHVDYYGLRRVSASTIEEAIGLKPGASAEFDREALMAELRAIDGVADARITMMMAPGSATVLVGILEEGAPELKLRPEPTGDVELFDSFLEIYDTLMDTTMEGLRKGIAGEDRSLGHAVSKYEPARELQEALAGLTAEHLDLVREVLRESQDPRQRAVAAHAVAYADDKAAIVEDLAWAVTDADSGVRNNAVRALSVMTEWANETGAIEVEIDATPFITMLDSVEWTDRNKAASLLMALSEGRDPELFEQLRARALPALEEMARWHSVGHAFFSMQILGRLAGLSNDETRTTTLELYSRPYEERMAWIDEIATAADSLNEG